MTDDFVELHGDRLFGDDAAIVAGFARIDGRRVAVIGQQKGADTDENIRRNFGMPHPEGYRKAMRVMELAERFGLPIVTFVDVPGAHPGPESEERGIAEAIARSIGADDPAADADRDRHHRRGRLGRRARDRRRRRRPRPRERRLLGHLARGLRRDPVADRRRGADGRAGDEDDRRRPAGARRRRRRRPRAAARAPTPTRPRRPAGSRPIIVRPSSSALEALPARRAASTRATAATVRSARPTLRSRRRHSRHRPPRRASADRLRDLLDAGPAGGRRRRRRPVGATSRRPARRSRPCPTRPARGAAPTARAAERPADHAAIDRLTDELLPALIAKLGATRPRRARGPRGRLAGPPAPPGRRRRTRATRAERRDAATARRSRVAPRGRAAAGRHRSAPARRRGATSGHGRDGRRPAATPTGPSRPRRRSASSSRGRGAVPGTRVRAGDRLGVVDVLGVPQEVVAPADGVVGRQPRRGRRGRRVRPGARSVIELAARRPTPPQRRARPDVPQDPHRQPGRDRAARSCARAGRSGIEAVVAYSEADRDSLRRPARRRGDLHRAGRRRAARTCPRRRSSRAALVTGCDAIHPGYGFLSEDDGLRRGRRAPTA